MLFWEEGGPEAPVLVSLRRKSATPIDFKVSYKIDINEFDDFVAEGGVDEWRSLKKLSLENGDDMDVVRENLAWYLHRVAESQDIYPVSHRPGMAAWVTFTAHMVDCLTCEPFEFSGAETVEPQGVYVNVEQPDKQFLKNREIWKPGDTETWLYKQDDRGNPERKEYGCDENDEQDSPTFLALQCLPYAGSSGKNGGKKAGGEAPVYREADLNALVDMNTMLDQAAVDAFMANADGIFTHEKSFFWADWSDDNCPDVMPVDRFKRQTYPWDLDESMGNAAPDVYGQVKGNGKLRQTPSQDVFLNIDNFRDIYNTVLDGLSSDAFKDDVIGYMDAVEETIRPHLEADSNGKVGGNVAGTFDAIRAYIMDRAADVRAQICADDVSFCP